MLNPSAEKYIIDFSSNLFDKKISEKYDEFLFHKNHPIKSIQGHIQESIQNLSTPGWSLNTLEIAGLPNLGINFPNGSKFTNEPTVNAIYPGTDNLNNIFDTKIINITFKNTILNWMFFYEYNRRYYDRKRTVKEFNINVIIKDSAEIDMLMFRFTNCFISNFPGLDFSFVGAIRESKTFDIGFTFNELEIKFLLPNFKLDVYGL